MAKAKDLETSEPALAPVEPWGMVEFLAWIRETIFRIDVNAQYKVDVLADAFRERDEAPKPETQPVA